MLLLLLIYRKAASAAPATTDRPREPVAMGTPALEEVELELGLEEEEEVLVDEEELEVSVVVVLAELLTPLLEAMVEKDEEAPLEPTPLEPVGADGITGCEEVAVVVEAPVVVAGGVFSVAGTVGRENSPGIVTWAVPWLSTGADD